MAVEAGKGGEGAGPRASASTAVCTAPGQGFEAFNGGTAPFSMQHTPPATQALPPTVVFAGCGLL